MKYKVWTCRLIVPHDHRFPEGFDHVPRSAAIDAIDKRAIPVLMCESGWGGRVTKEERTLVDRAYKKLLNEEKRQPV